MTRRAVRHVRRGTALISAVLLLLVMAAFSVTILSLRATDTEVDLDAIRRLRAEEAAWSGLHLAAWKMSHDETLKQDLATVLSREGDTWSSGSEPLIRFQGAVQGAGFEVAVWPRPEELRLHAQGVSDGVYCERWSRLPVESASSSQTPRPPRPWRWWPFWNSQRWHSPRWSWWPRWNTHEGRRPENRDRGAHDRDEDASHRRGHD